MKHLHKKLLFIAISSGLFFSSCKKDFLDVNQDPNRVTDQNITAELIFTQAEVAVGDRAAGGSASSQGAKLPLQFAQSWVGYMAANGDFARDPTETSYNIDFGFGNTLFVNTYNTLFDLHQAEVKGLAGKDTVLAGASIILSAKLYQEMVDLFGDIPYSQAFQNDLYPHPAYDKAQDIYNSLLLRLDTAITYMGFTASKAFAPADVINHGNQSKWIKFAKTLKLRLLIRQSEISGFNPAAEIAKITSGGELQTLGAGESISVNPGYVDDVDKQSPFYANYGYTPTGTAATTSTNANAYIVNLLSSTNDARIERFFDPVGSGFVGDVYGDEPGNLPRGNQSSYFGPALVGSATQDQWIFPSYESLFLKAEAIARGWVTGDANVALSAAITESFVWLGLTAGDAADYIDNNPDITVIPAGAPVLAKAKLIAFQKYLANVGIDPLESYADIRRLDFLTDKGYISVNPSRVKDDIPVRLLYPQSEYTTNAESVLKEGTIDPYTSKLFWDKP